MPVRTLVIDTATAACSVALIDDGKIIDRLCHVVGRGHAERLVPMVAALQDGGRADRILVDCGPGSFTGLRVGIAAARGLGFGWSIPVYGYSSMGLIAARAFRSIGDQEIVVVIEGGHGEVFLQSFARPSTAFDALRSLRPEDAIAALKGRRAVGTGTRRLHALDSRILLDESLPDAADAALLPPAHTSLPPRPIYGRAPDAKPMAAVD